MKFKKTIGILAVFSFISLAVLLTTCSNPFASNEEEGYFVIIIGASGNSRAALEYPPKGFPNAPDGALELKDLKFSVTFTPIPSGSPTTVEKQGTVDIRGTLTQGDYTVTTKVSLLDGTLYAQGCAIDNPVHINGGTNSITVWVYSVNDAAIPLIKARPQGGSYATGTAPKPLTVTASSIDGGVISYKWHSNTKPDEKGWSTIGENSASYTPPTATAGTTYYYVEVTNTKGGKTQTLTCGPAIVAVSADGATPAITAQPASNSILKGEKVTLAVAATVSNGGTLSYQWHANTKPTNSGGIPLGVSTASYITEPFDEPGTYYYYCVVTNTYSADGSTKTATVTSDVATITVSAIVDAETPKFTTQPPNPSILTNQTTNLTIVASVKDKGTLSYQWYSNTSDDNSGGSEINGATSTSYTTLPLANGTYYYYCVVTNTNLSVNGKKVVTAASDVSTVTVSEVINAQIPAINTHPQNASISPGATATLTIAASVTDGGTVTYQWYSNSSASNSGGSIISGATSTSYTTPPLSTGTSYYYCAVTNTNNKPAITGTTVETVESNVVAVTVIFNAQTPTITVPPTGTSIYAGQTATLSITATVTDGGTISYRWYGNSSASNSGGTPLDAHNDSYTTPPLNATGPHYYYCVVTNTNNSVNGTQEVSVASNAVTITVNPAITALAPTITSQPTGATYKQGDTPTNLTVSASSNDGGTLSYKWYDNGTTNSNTGGTLISGATSASYAPPTNVTGTFHYYCEVTNTIASNGDNGQKTATATSNAATVTVNAIVNAAPPSVGTPTVTPSSVTAGTAATLTVAATPSDSGNLSYQWYKSASATNSGGTAVTDGSGGTTASYTTPTTLATGSHYYYCVVTNTNNSVNGNHTATATSSVATVTVNAIVNAAAPSVGTPTVTPSSITAGTAATLTVAATASDGGNLSYQWYKSASTTNSGGTAVTDGSGGTTASYTTPTTLATGSHYYYCVVTNTNNSVNGTKTATATSSVATVTVNAIVNAAPPSVGTPTVTPSSVTAGTAATLTVAATASDSGILSYQWYKNTSPTNSGGNAVTDGSGGTSASYTTPTTLTTGSHYYYCVVTNTNNSATGTKTATATSSVATVTVTPLVIPQTPNITTQPKDAYYKLPATPTALTVTASVTDGGTLTYQWFSNTTFSNAGGSSVSSSSTSPTFTPPTSSTSPKGTIYYYVVITNTLTGNTTSIRSSPVVVIMDNDSPYSDSAGSGTSGDPFKVYDVATLQKVGTGTDGWSLSVYYEQVRHINLSSVSNWTAIGTQSVKFIGNYDGGGYTISNLTINSTSAAFQGLFGHISDSSKVINVGLVNCNIKAYHRIGGVVGFNNGATVENCYTTGSVSGNIIIGGVVGYNVGSGSKVENCYSTANVKGTEGNTSVGGVVGSNEGAIENCYSRGTVSGVDQVGGVVGLNKGNVKNCYATSNVSGTGVYVGGVAGESSDFMENCYATGNVSGTIQVGGVVGVSRSTSAVLQNCYATGNVSGTRQVGGVIGYNNGNVKNCYATGNVSDTEEQFGGVAGCNPNLNTVQNSVALNPNISGPTDVGRVAYNTGTLKDNYGRSDMTKNNNAGGWTSNATGVDGANITSANWNLESWWTGVGFSTTYWDFSDISTARGPTLKNMPGGVQNPVIK